MTRQRNSGKDLHGILLLDKRQGVSSNRALQEVRSLYNANKAGHTGSLDPLATGLLPICFGEATKVSAYMLDADKRYQVEIQLGVTTNTGDAEGMVLKRKVVPELALQDVILFLHRFIGEIEQIPPMYSALKHRGKKLYELAREGLTIERKSRRITIHSLQCLHFTSDCLTLEVHCSKGTYIRTLAEDLGQLIGCGASVKALRRLAVGRFALADAYTLEILQKQSDVDLLSCLRPVDEPLLSWQSIILSENQASRIKQGGQVMLSEQHDHGVVRIYSDYGFLGIGEIRSDRKLLIPKRLFNLVL